MNQRGEYGSRGPWTSAAVGALQAADAGRAAEQIDAEMEAILDATYRAMGADPKALRRPTVPDEAWLQRVREARTKASQSPLWQFWETTVSPKYDDWKATREVFRGRPMTADDYSLWLGRVQQLRAAVKARGIALDTPDLVDMGQSGSPPEGFDRSKLLRWGAIGALGVGAVVAVAALASSTKKEREPYERYRWCYLSAR